MRLKWGIFQSVFFEKTKKKVSIRGSHFSSHGGAVDLEIVPLLTEMYKDPPLISYRKGKSLKDIVKAKTIKACINTMGTQRESRRFVNSN